MRILGLDVGDKTIGVAISDELGWTAQGLEVIHRKSASYDIERLQDIVINWEVQRIIVGLPKNMNGTIGPRAEKCIVFAEQLEQILKLPVQLWDERLTTIAAERALLEADISRKKRKQVIDKMAAVMILQNFLDSK